MEAHSLLSEDSLASTFVKVKEEDVGMSVEGMYHNSQELNGEAKKRMSNPHDSLTDNESVDLQRGRTSLPHSQSETQIKPSCHSSLYFHDGLRSVDFVLVWDDLLKQSNSAASQEKRKVFERNLQREGLELEYEKRETSGLNFIKVHATLEVLRRYSEILKLRMPMREELCHIEKDNKMNPLLHATMYLSQKIPALQEVHEKTNSLLDSLSSYVDRIMGHFYVDTKVFPPRSYRFTAVYSRDKEYLFDIHSKGFFTPAIRSRIVQFILDRERFTETQGDDFAFGIERLINQWVYTAAYPLHDGELRVPGSMRNTLYTEWAAVNKCLRYQPLDYVKEYFGVKIGLYFAWLGFYTHMLIPASVVGVICFIYSCLTLYADFPSEDICNKWPNIIMCPTCDHFCDYWNLEETCLHAKVTYLFDNPSTVFFAIFMSFWDSHAGNLKSPVLSLVTLCSAEKVQQMEAYVLPKQWIISELQDITAQKTVPLTLTAMFLELWKRYSAEITHRWDLTGFDIQEEHSRPQYLARLKNVNNITNMKEPHVPFWRVKVPATVLSFSVVLLLVSLAVAAVIAVVLYRMSVLAALAVQGESYINSYALLFTTSTAASINLCCIMGFNWIYNWLAKYLTELELLRTQTEFDDSLTLKIYLLQFVNYYASIFYTAFFKGKFVGRPGDYNTFFGYRQEECGPGGCLMELCIQLAIIMVGKQIMNSILEMILPLFYKWLNTLKVKTGLGEGQKSHRSYYQWVKDFKLVDWGPQGLFPEYLEMVLQYGFVTIFVSAFPLAPFFALLNNILEMRLDAKKLLTYFRRPVTQRVRDIGVWYRILDSIGKLSVITNGFIIAFTSDFIPHVVYTTAVSQDSSLQGFLNFSLSVFNTSDLEPGSEPYNSSYVNVTECRYADYREPPNVANKYERTAMYSYILAARLAFVVVFENVVAVVMIVVHWCIPSISSRLRDQIRQEAYITNEIIIHQETLIARGCNFGGDRSSGDGDRNPCAQWGHFSGSDVDLSMLAGHELETTDITRKRLAWETHSSDHSETV